METKKYDATYHLGKTTVHIVSPETVLGRKMTEEEKQKVLDEIKKVNIDKWLRLWYYYQMYYSIWDIIYS